MTDSTLPFNFFTHTKNDFINNLSSWPSWRQMSICNSYVNVLSLHLTVIIDDCHPWERGEGSSSFMPIVELHHFHRLWDHPTSCMTSPRLPVDHPPCYGARGGALSFYSACFHQSNVLCPPSFASKGSDLLVWYIRGKGPGFLCSTSSSHFSQGSHSPSSSKPWFYIQVRALRGREKCSYQFFLW